MRLVPTTPNEGVEVWVGGGGSTGDGDGDGVCGRVGRGWLSVWVL